MGQWTTRMANLTAMVSAALFVVLTSAAAKDGEPRSCETKFGGQVVCGDLIIGITLEQYKTDLNKRSDEIRAEEAEKRAQLQKLLEVTERATEAEKDSLRNQIATVQAEKRALEAEGRGVEDRLAHLQASYDVLVQKLVDANAALQAFAPLISKDTFEQAQAMLRQGDLPGAERKFIEIADTVRKVREQADVVEARAIFQAGELAEQRIDLRKAYSDYTRAATLQPNDRRYVESAGALARMTGDFTAALSYYKMLLSIMASRFGSEATETAAALNGLALTYKSLARYAEAEPLYRRAIEIAEKTLGKDHPGVAIYYSNLARMLQANGKYTEAETLYRWSIEIDEKTFGEHHPTVASGYNDLGSLLQAQGRYVEAATLYVRAIEINEMALGKDHPDLSVDYSNLAGLLRYLNLYSEAEPLFRRSIEIDEMTFGKEHPKVAQDYNDLGLLLKSERKYPEAEPLYREAIGIGETALGKTHPDVAGGYSNLASLIQPLYQQAIEILQARLGPIHPRTLRVKKDYDRLLELMATRSKKSAQ